MSNSVVEKKFKTFVTTAYVFSFIILALFAIALLATIVAGVVLFFIPQETINGLLTRIPAEVSYEANGVSLQITDSFIESLTLEKLPIFYVLLASFINVGVATFIIFLVNRWLHNLKSGDVFAQKNSRFIESIGFAFVALGFLSGLGDLAMQHLMNSVLGSAEEIFEMTNKFIYSGNSLNYSIDLTLLFTGLLIWIIGRVFKYGTFLQNEFDATV
ncbi:DUF2975 domain-containing protein [Salinicoccus albus]|uniref:DUF2975 domain-containing protein n=1 Tax=Salinicoccus albus TaxID=418756 RepID=UPI000361EE80|nr:DUF2975 domain-containing protein [Salinicoccus albus]